MNRVRLICFPFAGGSSIAYRTWTGSLPQPLELVPFELPGRGSRAGEPPIASMSRLLERIMPDVVKLADGPYALFGHSMGARIAYELARRLPSPPVHVFAAASPAPHLPRRHRPSDLSETEFVAWLRRMGGTPREVLDDADLMAFFLPIVRADMRLVDDYQGTNEPPLGAPVTTFHGRHDTEVSAEEVQRWHEVTRAGCTSVVLDAGHFFLSDARDVIHRTIVETLS